MNADDLAGHVEERAARVAADERAVGAEEAAGRVEDPADADHGSAARLETAGMADGDYPLALLDVRGIAHLHEAPLAVLGDLDHAAVHALVPAERLALHALAVGEDQEAILAGLAGHVAGGKDVALAIDHNAAAGRVADHHADGAGDDLVEDLFDLLLDGPEVFDALRGDFLDGRGQLDFLAGVVRPGG